MKWTRDQINEAHRIVNDIAERVDNRESAGALREALAIYADLLEECREKRSRVASEETLEVLKKLMAGVPVVGSTPQVSMLLGKILESGRDLDEESAPAEWVRLAKKLEKELGAVMARVKELEERNTRDVVGLIQRLQEKTDREGFVNLAILHPELRALVEAEYREWLARAAEARRRSVGD